MERIAGRNVGRPAELDVVDTIEVSVDPAATPPVEVEDDVESLGRAALGAAPTLEDALLQPPPEHAGFPVKLGPLSEALARACSRSDAGEPPAVTRMKQVAAHYLEMRLLIAAGIGGIQVG